MFLEFLLLYYLHLPFIFCNGSFSDGLCGCIKLVDEGRKVNALPCDIQNRFGYQYCVGQSDTTIIAFDGKRSL